MSLDLLTADPPTCHCWPVPGVTVSISQDPLVASNRKLASISLIKTGIYGTMWGESGDKRKGWGTRLWKNKTGVSSRVQEAGAPGKVSLGLTF